MSLSFSLRKPGIKSLAKPLASQTHMAQRLLPILRCKNPSKCLQPASVFSLAQAKGLWWTMPAFRIVVSIKAPSAQLVDLYVNACVRWWLFNTVNAFGLKVVGFITLKPISVMAVNHWVPAPFSKMSTNALWTLSNTLISLESASGFESKCFYTWSMQQISNRNSDVPFASIWCCLTTHDFSFVKGLIFQSELYRMTRLMQILQLFVRCELSTLSTFFAELRLFLDPISPELCQLGEIQWNWANLVSLADVALQSWPTAKLTAEWWDFQVSAPSMLILQFLTETLQVRKGVNTLVDTNQDKKSPGTHLGLTLWLSSARVPICSFPASKRDDNPLRTMANWSGGLTLNVSDLKYNSLPFVWQNHPKTHLMPQQAFKHLQRRPALIWVVFFFCCIRAYTLAPCLHNCFRMSTRNGKGAYAGVFLD